MRKGEARTGERKGLLTQPKRRQRLTIDRREKLMLMVGVVDVVVGVVDFVVVVDSCRMLRYQHGVTQAVHCGTTCRSLCWSLNFAAEWI